MRVPRIALLMTVTVLLTGCSALSLISGQRGIDPISPNRSPQTVTATLYFGDNQAMYVLPEQRTILVADEPLPTVLVKELIAGPRNGQLYKTLPAETRLLGLEIKDGVAYVDFSKEVATKHWGGSAGELMTVASVVNTLTELPEITSVQFLVEGQVQDAIWGHGVTSEPIKRIESRIGK